MRLILCSTQRGTWFLSSSKTAHTEPLPSSCARKDYTSNLSYAVDRANSEILEEATIKWQREDFEAALEEKGLEPSKLKEKPDLDSSKEPKEYGIDQLMADLSDETPETGEDGPGGRD